MTTVASAAFTIAALVFAWSLLRAPTRGRAAPAQLAAGIGLAMDFLLAAGLLRLSAIDDFAGLAAVAAIVLLRKAISTGLGLAARGSSAQGSTGS